MRETIVEDAMVMYVDSHRKYGYERPSDELDK